MSEWRTCKISDIYAGLYDGPHATPPDSDEGAIFLGISNITKNGHIDLTTIKHISVYDLPKWTKRVEPQEGDIVFSYEATLNLYALIPKGFWGCLGRRMALIRPDESKCYGKFLYYYFFSEQWRRTIAENTIIGATVDRIPIAKFPEFPVMIPERSIQKTIVDALSAYDDLIENNRHQIKLLEEAAQRLYKEWFVDLHFPGHEDVEIIDSVPYGWKKVSVNESLAHHMNGGWGKENPTGNNTHPGRVIRGTDINDIKSGKFDAVPLRYHSDNDVSKRCLQKGDIVFELSNGNIDNIGRSLLIDDLILNNCGKNTICASFCKMFRPIDRLHGLCLYWEIQEMQLDGRMMPFKKQGANGINNFAFEDFLEHQFLVPNTDSLLEPLENLMNEISNIQRRFALLKEARDRLLPKLMSGEIEL